jgi:hypothetical protein
MIYVTSSVEREKEKYSVVRQRYHFGTFASIDLFCNDFFGTIALLT